MLVQEEAETKFTYTEGLIPIYEIHRDPNDESNIVAIPIQSKNFPMLIQGEMNTFVVEPVDYEIFRQDQLYDIELKEKLAEQERLDKEIDFDPDVGSSSIGPEEQMTSIRANQLYNQIMDEYENIILARKNYDFDHDSALELEKQEYYDQTVYERAWEVNDIIDTLIEGGYQKKTLFGNYKEIYVDLQGKQGKECVRNLVRLARLMSRCVSPEVLVNTEDVIESTIPGNASMRDA